MKAATGNMGRSVIALAAFVVLGCGGSSSRDAGDVSGDESVGADADADVGADADTGLDTMDDGGADVVETCDPVTQSPCGEGMRCVWVPGGADTGQAECVAAGTVGLGGACAAGATGDECARGLQCLGTGMSGSCQAICGLSPDTCSTNYVCSSYAGYFGSGGGGAATAGLCEPTCNPLTQTRNTDGAANCGGPLDASGHPTLGCYGMPNSPFTCVRAGDPAKTSDAPAADPSTGTVYLNGCAPGFIPLLYDGTGSTTAICVALCAPGDTWEGNAANAAGLVGSGHTCPDAGAGGTHECRYWWFLEDPAQPATAFSDTLGYCFDYTRYQYDSNGDGMPDTTYPSCTALSDTAETFQTGTPDYLYWGCGAH